MIRKIAPIFASVSILFMLLNSQVAFSAAPAGLDYAYEKESSDGSLNKVEADVQAIPPGIADPVTIETWINIEEYTGDWMAISSQNQDQFCCTNRLWFGIYGPSGYFHVGTGSATINSADARTQIPVNTWTHVALTLGPTGTNNLKIYINGTLFHTDTLSRSSSTLTNGFAIGTNTSGYHRFDGRFDNFKIWNTVLSETQIRESRYAYGSEGVSGSPSLRAFYDFDEGTGITVTDRTGNGYSLTISNTQGTTQDTFVGSTRQKAISYNNQGATTAQSGGAITFNNGGTIAAIPTTPPQRTSFAFAGWFTAASGGTQIINGSSMPNNREATVILYAQWTDSSPPTFTSASVGSGGTTITMVYNETLSSTTAAASRFTITANGNAISVSSVAASSGSVTLNLSSTIFISQTVLLSYADPTGSNDANAIQDSTGNDAASLTGQSVTNSSTQKQNQTITFNSIANKTYGDAAFTLSASDTTTSGLSISYTIDPATTAVCQISTRTVTILASGTCTVNANQAGNSNFNAASQVQQSFTIATKAISIKATDRSVVYTGSSASGSSSYTITAGGLVGSDTFTTLTYTFSSVSLGYSSATAPTVTGSYVISPSAANFTVGSSSNYSITYQTGTLTISRATQASFSLSSVSGVFLTNLRLTTSGGSDTGTISFSVSSLGTAGCSIANSDSLTSTTAGSCQVVATKLGTANYLPAFDTQTITISKANLVLTTSAAATLKYGSSTSATYSADRTVGVGGIPAISGSLAYETSTSTACNINSSTGLVTMNRASGTCSVRVRLSNDTNFQDTSSALVSITPAKADAIIVTADGKTSTYTGSATSIAPTYSVSGLQFQDTVTVTYGYSGSINN